MSKIIVVGDVHGDLNQLLYPLIEFFRAEREENENNKSNNSSCHAGTCEFFESGYFGWDIAYEKSACQKFYKEIFHFLSFP